MKMKVYCLIIFMLLGFLSCKKEKANIKPDENKTAIFQHILDSIYTSNKDAVGLMVHVEAPDQGISWSGAVGFSDKEKQIPIQSDQPAVIASNTKTYVSVAILRLIEENKLKLDTALSDFLTEKTNTLLSENGYLTQSITIQHLLSHTSGIVDYAGTEAYFELIKKDLTHKWTRDEQIELAMSMGKPLGKPSDIFAYADTNYLLLTEVIEQITKQHFYKSIRELLDFKSQNLNATWFLILEKPNKPVKPLVHQYVTSMGLNSFKLNQSFDLYGGGGLASTTKDLAQFSYNLFNNKILKNPETLNLIYTKAEPKKPMEGDYYLGLSSIDVNGTLGYGHGGFWGTAVNYFPDLNASISVFVLERDKRILRLHLNQALVKALKTSDNLNR